MRQLTSGDVTHPRPPSAAQLAPATLGEVFTGVLRTPSGVNAARFYLFLVTPILLALNLVFPAFHGGDDYDHFKRAYTLAHGAFWPETVPGRSSGGMVDVALAALVEAQRPTIFEWPRNGPRLPPAEPAPSGQGEARWSGEQIYSEFPGAISYLPLVYVPQAAAIWVGERTGLTVVQTVLLARLLNGFTAVAVITAALAGLPAGTASVLLLLLLPKSLQQFASNSHVPLLHAVTISVLAFCLRSVAPGGAPRTRHFVLVAVGLLAAASARPPLAAMALVPLWVAWRSRNKVGAAAIALGVAMAVAWFAEVIPQVTDLRCGPVGDMPGKLLLFAEQGPLLIARSVWWRGAYYYQTFVGELGWGNGPAGQLDPLPTWIYLAVPPVFGLALLVDAARPATVPGALRLLLILCSAAMVVATFAALYGICTAPESRIINGVQGPYLYGPALIFVPAVAGCLRPTRWIELCYLPLLFLLLAGWYVTLLSAGLRIYWIQ